MIKRINEPRLGLKNIGNHILDARARGAGVSIKTSTPAEMLGDGVFSKFISLTEPLGRLQKDGETTWAICFGRLNSSALLEKVSGR